MLVEELVEEYVLNALTHGWELRGACLTNTQDVG